MRWILVLCLAGCGAAEGTDTEKAPLPPMEDPDQPRAARATGPAADNGCPLALPGAQVRSEVTADGVALVFTTTGGDAAELRDRVQRMADRHNAQQAPAGEPDTGGAAGGGDPAGGMSSPEGAHGVDMHGAARSVPSRAAVEEIAGGARIVFTPSDPAKVGLLREHIRVHGKEMAEADCGQEREPAKVPPPPPQPGGDTTMPEPTPAPRPDEPVLPPDRPVTPPDQPVTPPAPPPPPTGVPFLE
ncbi:MAG TPA: hypothetical protein VFU21_28650 [Kofleriaceae bacterium]|nr:hypothetical protein [Kofleriaceae bacterium]